jgi:8-oxo-dGTP diphosphatase
MARIIPRAAASMAVFDGAHVLLIERGKGAPPGLWSLPGGHIEPAATAAVREVQEETGIVATLSGLLDVQDIFIRDASGELVAHYLIAVHYGRAESRQTPHAMSDARDAKFVSLGELGAVNLTAGGLALIHRAAHILGLKP